MIVTVYARGHLKHFRPDRADRFVVELPLGATVRDAISASGVPWAEVGLVAAGEHQVGDDHLLADGDELVLLPPMEGG